MSKTSHERRVIDTYPETMQELELVTGDGQRIPVNRMMVKVRCECGLTELVELLVVSDE